MVLDAMNEVVHAFERGTQHGLDDERHRRFATPLAYWRGAYASLVLRRWFLRRWFSW
jgi:hypothetical protein